MIQRKNAFKLTKKEQDAYKNGISAMISDGSYGTIVAIHSRMKHRMHFMNLPGYVGRLRFLPWHRAYLWHFEKELRKRQSDAFIPYWNSTEGGVPDWIKTFKPDVDVPGVGKVKNNRVELTGPITPASRLKDLHDIDNYVDFTRELENNPHNIGHVRLGTPMNRVPTAPADPMFFMHHGEIDRIWARWQNKNPSLKVPLTGTDAVMDPWTEKATDLSSITALDYEYV